MKAKARKEVMFKVSNVYIYMYIYIYIYVCKLYIYRRPADQLLVPLDEGQRQERGYVQGE